VQPPRKPVAKYSSADPYIPLNQLGVGMRRRVRSIPFKYLHKKYQRELRDLEIKNPDHPFTRGNPFQGQFAEEWAKFADSFSAYSRTRTLCEALLGCDHGNEEPRQFKRHVLSEQDVNQLLTKLGIRP